jgi:tetrapyrrole methylase family protein/MazG family protein
MIFRHPHVFNEGDKINPKLSINEVSKNWDKLKQVEREKSANSINKDPFIDIPYKLPALLRALKVQKRASESRLDWPQTENALSDIYEEIGQVSEAIKMKNTELIKEEIGTLLFSVVNLAKEMNVEPEVSLNNATEKFITKIKDALSLFEKKLL